MSAVQAERRRVASAFNAKVSRLMQRRSVGHGRGLVGQSMRQPMRKREYNPRVKATSDDKALQALELAMTRASSWKHRLYTAARTTETDVYFVGHGLDEDAPMFDVCMSGHNPMPAQMAWPVHFDAWDMNWEPFEAQWTYDKSMRVYVKN